MRRSERPEVKRARALIEVGILLVFVQSYMWLWPGAFPGAGLTVGAVIILMALRSLRARGETLHDVGVRTNNLRPAIADAAFSTLPFCALLLAAGHGYDRVRPDWLVVLSRFPWLIVWGFLQQFVLQAFVHRRLRDVFPPRAAAIAAAIYFALCHLPNPRLMIATFAGGWVWSICYRRHPNLLVLAVAHALGSACLSIAFGPELMRGMRVGLGYLSYIHFPNRVPGGP